MQQESEIILVVDLDGALVKTDMLFESFWSVFSKKPSLSAIHSSETLIILTFCYTNLRRFNKLEVSQRPPSIA